MLAQHLRPGEVGEHRGQQGQAQARAGDQHVLPRRLGGPVVSSIATSSAETTVVTSIAIHSSARLLISGAASIAQANTLNPR